MIRPLRARHRTVITLLAVGVPLVFVAGLSVRRPAVVSDPLTLAGATATDPSAERLLLRTDPAAGLAVDVVLLDAGDAGATVRVVLTVDPARPELLVYWSAGASQSGLPDDARLLGALAGTRPAVFTLPMEARRQPGRLSFYSLTQQELVAQLDLPAVGRED